jgi:hypothetical protein
VKSRQEEDRDGAEPTVSVGPLDIALAYQSRQLHAIANVFGHFTARGRRRLLKSWHEPKWGKLPACQLCTFSVLETSSITLLASWKLAPRLFQQPPKAQGSA